MNARVEANEWTGRKFGVGQPAPRSEDPRLLTGGGRYTDDINLERQVYAAIVRSPYAHGTIREIDLSGALDSPGVLGAYKAADLAAYGPLKCIVPFNNRDGSPMSKPLRPALAADRVRFVGDPVAFVVAETPAQAKEAAEAVLVDIDPLPAVTDAVEAAKPGAPLLYDEAPGNVVLDYLYGDPAKVEAAFAEAAHVTRLTVANNRVVVSAMEPRAALAEHDPASGRWTLHVGCQGAFGMRGQAADILGVETKQVHVLVGNVGGSFGMKAAVYPEYVCILHAARALGRPVKWTDERSTSFLSDQHGRDHELSGELALDAEGRFLAVRVKATGNMGGYLGTVSPLMPTLNIVKNVISVYRTPALEVSAQCVVTNTTPVSAYRGAGRPEANYLMERLVETAAAEMGLDALELRRKNHIRPDELPWKAPSGMVYDSGEFTALLDRALEFSDWSGFPARKEESRRRGKLRGRGLGSYLEVTAPANKEMGGIRFEADGTVTMITGTLDYGQGHATPFAQVVSARLGIPFDKLRLLQGDSDELLAGGGTGGSRSMASSGMALVEASDLVIERGRQIAAVALEAAAADIEFADGRFTIAGTDRSVTLMELARQLREGLALPDDGPQSLDVGHVSDGAPSAFPNGCHVAEVEIDPETGETEVVRYVAVNDFGTIVNPMIVDGQMHGGVVQGIGQALMERTVFDSDGQPLAGSYMDYAVPRADDAPPFVSTSRPAPARTNPLGVKGCGEAGCAGALSSVMNAVVDALGELGVRHVDMPATAPRIWQIIQEARKPVA